MLLKSWISKLIDFKGIFFYNIFLIAFFPGFNPFGKDFYTMESMKEERTESPGEHLQTLADEMKTYEPEGDKIELTFGEKLKEFGETVKDKMKEFGEGAKEFIGLKEKEKETDEKFGEFD